MKQRETILASGVSSDPPIHTQATARPWHLGSTLHTELVMGFRNNSECVIAELDTEIDMTDAENVANAALIVKAVNSHEALVKALELARARIVHHSAFCGYNHQAHDDSYVLPMIDAALAGAK